jgi:hypothetical protein
LLRAALVIQYQIKTTLLQLYCIHTLPNFTATCELENANISIIDNGDTTNGNYQPMVQLGQMYLILHRIQMLQQTP